MRASFTQRRPQSYYNRFNTEDFISQARAFEADGTDFGSKLVKLVSVMAQTHPWTVLRANHFLSWIDSGEYEAVLRSPEMTQEDVAASLGFCDQCGAVLSHGDMFCTGCGRQVSRETSDP